MVRVLIFGGSSSIGEKLFKELNPFYDLHATYCYNNKFKDNKRYIYYNLENDPIPILTNLKPDVVISGLRGNFNLQVSFYELLIGYCEKNKTKLMFLSSSNVFDSFINYPSYEEDKTFSRSVYGRFNIHIENKILRMKNKNWCINRSSMIFSKNSKRINDLKLKNPQIVGFGISNYDTFNAATTYAKGAIIGSAFIKYLKTNGTQNINKFIKTITSK